MTNSKPIPSVKLTTLREGRTMLLTYPELFVLKHRGANHPVVGGVHTSQEEALEYLNSIPGGRRQFGAKDTYCQGCGVGCWDEYEIVCITPKMKDWKMKKLKVKSL